MLRLLAALSLLATAAAAAEPPDARASFVERRGLIEADARCALFAPNVRLALRASAAQARGALLRSGWSPDQVNELADAVADSAAARRCDDPRTLAAASSARTASAHWLNASAMEFPGWARSWTARRAGDALGFRLWQSLETPTEGQFGVRGQGREEHLALLLPLAQGAPAPRTAELVVRDARRAAARDLPLSARVTLGLAAGAPEPQDAESFVANATVQAYQGRRFAAYVFPAAAFRALMALDPRESAELRVSGRPHAFLEIGDVAAAATFLNAAG